MLLTQHKPKLAKPKLAVQTVVWDIILLHMLTVIMLEMR